MTVFGRLSAGSTLVIGALLGACIGGGALPVTHYYTLRPPAAVTESSARESGDSGWVVGVPPFAVDPPYDQDRLVYRRGVDSTEVGFYAYHRWASPLGRLVAVALADGLRGTAGIVEIEPARAAGDYSARLEGRLLYLEELDSEAGQEARLSLQLDLRSDEGELLWTSVLTGSASGRVRDVSQVATLAQQAFDDVVRQASAGIESALGARPGAAIP